MPISAPGGVLEGRDEIVGYRQGQTAFVDGLTQKTCRDVIHAGHNALLNRMGHAVDDARTLKGNRRPAESGNLFVAREALNHGNHPGQ